MAKNLEDKVKRRKEEQQLNDEEYRRLLKEAAKILQRAPEGHLVGLIRKSRDEHSS